jgi:hypothetical protein
MVAAIVVNAMVPAVEPARAQSAESPASTCDYTTHGWSTMRNVLQAVARFHGDDDAAVRMIARRALSGDERYLIGGFEVTYAYHRYDRPPPNNAVCYPQRATFDAIRNDGRDQDAAYSCETILNLAGEVESLNCTLIAG